MDTAVSPHLAFPYNSHVSEILLQTKIHRPPIRPSIVSRPHLIQKLNTGLTGKLTLVSAPPGFGKSTLVSSWLHQIEQPSTWLSLDNEDNDPNRFLLYLTAALQKIEARVGQTAVPLLQSPQPPPPEILLTLLINDLAAMSLPIILVLEDYHLIHNLDIHKALAFFLDNQPAVLHLVITSREDPPLPLHRLRSSGQMNGIYAYDLRFSEDEAATFLQQTMHVHLIPEDISALAKRTEGWVAGLQLAALSLQGLPDAHEFVTGFAGDDRYIADYLLHEVIERQPQHIQAFLWQTALLDRLCAPLCDAFLAAPANHSQPILTYLDEANLFVISLDNKREWYRYHHLFSDFLRQHVQKEMAHEIPDLYRRAAAWYEDNGFLAEAIEYALASKDYQRAGRLIEQNRLTAIFGHAQWATFLKWMEALPSELLKNQPQLNLHYAWALFSTGRWQETEPYLNGVEQALQRGKETTEQKWLLGEVATIRSLVLYEAGKLSQCKEMAAVAFELLPESNQTIRSVAVLAAAMAHMWGNDDLQSKHQSLQQATAIAQSADNATVGLFALGCRTMLAVRAGQLQQAATFYSQAKTLGTIGDNLLLGPTGFACVQMGEVLREWNRLAEAEQILRQGIMLCQQQSGMPVWIIEGHVTLARLKLAAGDVPEAEKLMRLAEALLIELPGHGETVEHLVAATQVYRLRYWLARGKSNQAFNWLAEHNILADSEISPENATYHILLARILLEQGQLEKTQRQVGRLAKIVAESEPSLYVELLILQALLQQARGQLEQAAELLIRSLRFSEPEGYVRLFLEFGQPLAYLLPTAVSQGAASNYIKNVLAAFGRLPTPSPPALPGTLLEPLNDREQQILKLMAGGLSNREIAAELYLSVNTIKVYTSRIYGKLGVNGRAEAINHAHELGIL